MPKTIPQLTDATTVNAADELIIQQSGITKRATGAELAKGLNAINGTVNVKDFGAVGDGVADDTVSFQSFINAGGGCVSSGTYMVSGLTIPSNTALIGWGNATIKALSGTTNIFSASNASNVTVQNLTIDGNSHASRAIFFDGSSSERITVSGNVIKDVTSDAIWFQSSKYTVVTENTILNVGQHGVTYTAAAEHFVASNNLIKNPGGAGIIFSQGNFGAVVGNVIEDGGPNGDSITGYHQLSSDITIAGNVINKSSNHGIHVGGTRISIIGNTILDCFANGIFIGANTSGTSVNPEEPSYNVVATGNIIDGTATETSWPIFFRTVSGGVISSNNIINSSGVNIYVRRSNNIVVSDNSIQGGATHGIVLGGSSKCAVKNNLIDSVALNSIRLQQDTLASENNVISNNTTRGGNTAYVETSNSQDNKFISNNATGYSVSPFVKIGSLTTWTSGIPFVNTLASATPLLLEAWGDVFEITGSTQISRIVASNAWNGRQIMLMFKGSITVVHRDPLDNSHNIKLSGATNFAAISGNTLSLVYDGQYFIEVARGTASG